MGEGTQKQLGVQMEEMVLSPAPAQGRDLPPSVFDGQAGAARILT